MSLNKITKPKWATGAPSYAVEPSESKKTVGWKSQEKPPYQWMNWLFLKAYQWFGWGEERTEFSDSASFHTTGASVTWSGTQIAVPAGGLYLEWRSRNTIINNILPEATYSLADGEYLVFIPHATPGTVLAAGVYATLVPGQYAIVAGAALVDNVTYTEIIVFKRRGGILEVPLFKTAVQAGGALASNDLLVHKHSDTDDGGQLDWDEVWADAVHNHQIDAEGSILDHGNAMTGLGDDDHPQYAHLNKASQTFLQTISGQTPSLAAHLATKAYVDGLIPDMSHVCYDNTSETISQNWTFNANIIMGGGFTVDGVNVSIHTHDLSDGGLAPTNWNASFSVVETNPAAWDEASWYCEFNCTADGKIYFNEYDDAWSGAGWQLYHSIAAGSEIILWDNDTAATIQTIGSIVFTGGTSYYIQCQGNPDLSAYTVAQNARFRFSGHILQRWTNNYNNYRSLYRLFSDADTGDWSITLESDGVASDDIAFCTLNGLGMYVGAWDSDDTLWTVNSSFGGSRWNFGIYLRLNSGDRVVAYIQTVVIPTTTTSPN